MAGQANLKTIVRGAYDVQKLRIQMGNRVVGNFKAKLGQKPGKKETDTLSKEDLKLLTDLRKRYRIIMDGIKKFPKKDDFKGDEVISSYTELCLVSQYLTLEDFENTHFKHLEGALQEFDIYNEFLEKTPGVGPKMAGVVLSEIDISKAKYASSIWAYAGLDVGPDGLGRSRRKEHQKERSYIDKNGKPATKMGITFNPFLKTKLMGVLAPSFLRARECPYATVYYNYKTRLEGDPRHASWHLIQGSGSKVGLPSLINEMWIHNKTGEQVFEKPEAVIREDYTEKKVPKMTDDYELKQIRVKTKKKDIEGEETDETESRVTHFEVHKKGAAKDAKPIAKYAFGKSKGHRHNMALRKAVKIFLIDLYRHWRKLEKLPVHPPYHEAKLGLVHAG